MMDVYEALDYARRWYNKQMQRDQKRYERQLRHAAYRQARLQRKG